MKVSSSHCDPVVEQNLVVEFSETTVSPLTNGHSRFTTSKKVREDAIWMQLVELHQHVQKIAQKQRGEK